jgi:hypothetical protein
MTKKPVKRDSGLGAQYGSILGDITSVIDAARKSATRSVNCIMTAAYWLIGQRIVRFEQGGKARAEYGKALLNKLSSDLTRSYGRGYSVDNLERFRSFYLTWPIEQISATLSRKSLLEKNFPSSAHISQKLSEKIGVSDSLDGLQNCQTLSGKLPIGDIVRCFPLPWSAYVRLLSVNNELARKFYETEALRGGWSVRQLDRQLYCTSAPRGV